MFRILCVRFSSIGDVLLTTPLVRALHRRHPEAELYFVTKGAMAPLVVENPHLTQVIELEPHERIIDLARRLRPLGATCEAGPRLLQRELSGGVRDGRAQLGGELAIVRAPERDEAVTQVLELHCQRSPVPRRPAFGRVRGLDRRPFAALAPGAAHATKRWPTRHWRALAAQLENLGYGLVALGGPDDRELAAELGPAVANTAGEFTLQETGACLARARVLVSGDTGVMHMATGVGTRVVALFGPTVEPFGFFPYTKQAAVLKLDLDCRPCSAMGTERCPLGHHRCLEEILPEQVTAALQRLVA